MSRSSRRPIMKFPHKTDRERFEIAGFIEAYARQSDAPYLSVLSKGERPDYVVKNSATGAEYGVELTSAYMDDRSVPDVHMRDYEGLVEIPYDRHELARYGKRLAVAVMHKVCKARSGYDLSRPLILAVYVNEYIGIYLGKPELTAIVDRYKGLFDGSTPFVEVVFWNLGNGNIFSIKRI